MIGLLGKKVGMTQLFDKEGKQIPVTVLEVGPCHVTALRTVEKNGYSAVQLAFDPVREKLLSKATVGQFKKAKVGALRMVREFRTTQVEGLQTGSELRVDNFQAGDYVDVIGTSIGRGFQGVVKRHGFKGAQTSSHGTKHGRESGSIGQSAYPSRVLKGMKMGGQMGNKKVTVQSLKVVQVDAENNLLVVGGAVPGVEGGYLEIRKALKRGKGSESKWKVQEAAKKAAQEPKAEGKLQEASQAEAPAAKEAPKAEAPKKQEAPKAEAKPETPKQEKTDAPDSKSS